jgi:hypothetical protein
VRESAGKEKHLNVVYSDGKSIWTKTTKKLKSVGSYEVRYTDYFSTIFE